MSIWTTVEAEAWARGLRYEDYVNLHYKNSTNALTEKSYRLICEAFDVDLEQGPGREKFKVQLAILGLLFEFRIRDI